MIKRTLVLVAAMSSSLMTHDAFAQEQPTGCNASAVGVRLVPTVNLVPIPPSTCVIPGQEITYRTNPFISPNPPPVLGIEYCDVFGGQLGVTFPNWEAALPPGSLRPDQFVPVAGYGGLPDIPQYGNGDGGASDPIPLFTVPDIYLVDTAHADADGFLNARSDYGQTSFLNFVGLMQVNGTVLGNPPQQTATATITNGLPMCIPEILLEKTPSQGTVCDGVPTEITYTYMVTNISTPPPGQPDGGVPDLTNISLTDDTCDVIDGPLNDDGDGLLNPGETWIFTCTTTVSATTTNTATVTANAQAIFPAGQTIDTIEYTDTAQATVTATPSPTVSVDPPSASICSGESQQFCAVPAGGTPPYSFSWSGPGGFTADTECITVGAAGEYCITVTDANDCFDTACVTLTVNDAPEVSIDPPTAAICLGFDQQFCAVVNGTGPFDYAWTGPGGFSADTECITVDEAGEYCVTVTDANGCTNSACATLTVAPDLSVSVDPPSGEICDGDSIEFCAVVGGGDPPLSFTWIGPGGFAADTQCITVGAAGEYCITVTDANGCSGSACATLAVNDNPQVSISPPSAELCEGETQEFCAVVGGGTAPFDYQWSGPGGFSAGTECITVGEAGEYCLTVTDANGCSDSACATLTINPSPDVSIDPPFAAICEGFTQQFCAVVSSGTAPFDYSWTGPGGFAAATECITVDEAGEYCVTVTDANGCSDSACATLEVSDSLSVAIAPPSADLCEGESQQFCAIVAGGTAPFDYEWTGPGGFSASTQCITVDEAGEYCVTVTDASGCSGAACATLTVNENPPCSISGPNAVNENTTENYCGPAGPGLSYDWDVAGNCAIDGADDGQCVDIAIGAFPGSCDLSLTVTSAAGCVTTCELNVTIMCVDCPDNPGGCSEKGSLLVWSKVELRWNQDGELIQDTFISLINDYPQDVQVLLYFINGDPETYTEPGWNWVDNGFKLTKNEPCYWSAFTGEPKGVSPFTVLDPGLPPGRPCTDGSGDRCLRGYIVGWAVNASGEEIKWNHLAGTATLVNYEKSYAWEYNACAFPVADPALPNGEKLGTPGMLMLDGTEYAPLYDVLIMDFYAAGSTPFAPGNGPREIVAQTDLTLHPGDVDLRQETEGPVTTKAHFNIWNQNEVKFSGTYRCITCWDQTLLRDYGIPNHFLRENLQTDKGKARIDGLASQLCDYDNDPGDQKPLGEDPNDIVSVDAALLGVIARFLSFNEGMTYAASGTNLHGAGTQSAAIKYDPIGLPPESTSPKSVLDALLTEIERELERDR